jgi:hypothetical protein
MGNEYGALGHPVRGGGLVCSPSSPIRAKCPTHLILLDFTTRTILGEEYKSFSSSLCNFLHSPVTSSLLGPNTLLNTLSPRSSLNVSDQVSHPYKTTGKIMVLYILIFKFWGHAVAQWLRHCATNRKVAGLIPDGVGFFH